MNEGTKDFIRGLTIATALCSAITACVYVVKHNFAPTEEFINAKADVADVYNVTPKHVRLYRHDSDSMIWDRIIESGMLSDAYGLYPRYVYTAEVNGEEKVLDVVIASKTPPSFLDGLAICDKRFDSYEYTYEYVEDSYIKPLYTINIYVANNVDVQTIVEAIETEVEED